MDTDIRFPFLHIHLEDVGKYVMIGDFSIAYYGIVIACGMLSGLYLATRLAKKTKQNPDTYYDLAIWAIIFSLIGARLYYVAFQWDYYKEDLLRILQVRQGGLAIYGGVIAGTITTFVFAKIKKINFRLMADTAGPGLLLGQCIGRWGNFFNREAFGGYCDNIFAMQLPVSAVRRGEITEELWKHVQVIDGVSYIQVHPTFLYESLWNLILLIIILLYYKHKKFDGEIFLIYMLGYGIGRFWIESLRTDQLVLPVLGIPVSMVVAAVMVIIAILFMFIGRRKKKMN